MRTSEHHDKIDAAMALIQAAIGAVVEDKAVEVDGQKAKWAAGYATLEALDKAIRGHLQAHGVALYQGGHFETGAGWVLVTRASLGGQWVETWYPIKPSRDGAQGFGGGITFARRWGLCGMFRIAPSEREEAQGYTDERRVAKAAKTPAGLPAMLAGIRDADVAATLTERARAARAAHPTGEGAAAVEKAIADWFVHVCGVVQMADHLAEIRDAVNTVKPRGAAVLDALRNAERRIGGK